VDPIPTVWILYTLTLDAYRCAAEEKRIIRKDDSLSDRESELNTTSGTGNEVLFIGGGTRGVNAQHRHAGAVP
jgi:hypothetical protein